MTNQERSGSRERLSSLIAEISVVVSGAVAALSLAGIQRSVLVSILIPLVGIGVLLILAIRRLYTVRAIPITLALAGAPMVGKTVYVNALFGQLMEGRSELLSFVPEAKTAQHVYQTLRQMRRGVLPQTGPDAIDRYRGKLGLTRMTHIRRLLAGRVEFDLEIGDTAGENWSGLAQESSRRKVDSLKVDSLEDLRFASEDGPQGLISSTFFEYVGESDVLFYFIDISRLVESSHYAAEQADDLLSTLQLLKVIEGLRPGSPLRKPLALVLSKVDLLTRKQFVAIDDLLSAQPRSAVSLGDDLAVLKEFRDSMLQLQRLVGVLESQTVNFRVFALSSVAEPGGAWHAERLDPFRVEQPLEWSFFALLKNQRRSRV
jgi:hypothetical protein